MTSADAVSTEPIVYQGHYGEFTITEADRREVQIYRGGLVTAAVSFAIATALVLAAEPTSLVLNLVTALYGMFWAGLGVSLYFIHIYLRPLHRALQLFWLIGGVASVAIAIVQPGPLALTVYQQPLTILGVGFTFAALTGIAFKEAFCFNRLETRFLTPLIPFLLLGHMVGLLPADWEQILLGLWAVLLLIFASRKLVQDIPADIGDKSVFAYLEGEIEAPEPEQAA